MLGAGFVTLPTLHILSDAGIAVTVGMANTYLPKVLYSQLTYSKLAEPSHRPNPFLRESNTLPPSPLT